MRVVTFKPYATQEDPSYSQFIFLYSAFVVQYEGAPQIGDRANTRLISGILDQLEEISRVEGNRRILLPSGGSIALEEAAYTVLKTFWDAYRAKLPALIAREVVAMDELIDGAPSYTLDEWTKLQKEKEKETPDEQKSLPAVALVGGTVSHQN